MRKQQLFAGHFCDLIVARGLYPPRSPDLNPPYFFLWGFLKEIIDSNNPRSLEDLKHNTEQAVSGAGQ
jgi:hypothetical protein